MALDQYHYKTIAELQAILADEEFIDFLERRLKGTFAEAYIK
jgi:hypothetical protein